MENIAAGIVGQGSKMGYYFLAPQKMNVLGLPEIKKRKLGKYKATKWAAQCWSWLDWHLFPGTS